MKNKRKDMFKIRPTPGIKLEDLSTGTIVDYRCRHTLSLRTERIVSISPKGVISVINAYGDNTKLTIDQIRKIHT